MSNDTEQKPENQQEGDGSNINESDYSRICGVSIRGWIAVGVVATICAMSVASIEIKEPLYTLGGLIVGFYYGHQQGLSKKKN